MDIVKLVAVLVAYYCFDNLDCRVAKEAYDAYSNVQEAAVERLRMAKGKEEQADSLWMDIHMEDDEYCLREEALLPFHNHCLKRRKDKQKKISKNL